MLFLAAYRRAAYCFHLVNSLTAVLIVASHLCRAQSKDLRMVASYGNLRATPAAICSVFGDVHPLGDYSRHYN